MDNKFRGIVIQINRNYSHPTTCVVKYSDGNQGNTWTDKIAKID